MGTIKKWFTVVVCSCLPIFGMSQSILDKFEDSDRVGSITISKGMLDIVADAMSYDKDEDTKDFVALAKSIDNIRVFISEDKGASADMAVTMKQYVKSSRLEELMKIKDKDTNLRFYIKNGKNGNNVEELLMFVTGIEDEKGNDFKFETILLTMTGDIDLAKVSSLTNKMNLPKELNRVNRR
ncbi:DUF4252 domain-containing protein [Flagellimonas sp. HMM57]|uniref:DUF4252 domain-containing protein n=1 Tax=unclassified Flagellimonas TaxID=2644544 RepID=UPI0013D840A5|nr:MULTISPECIES: DUF4252 domain-containing protein [unclassified Flagellimonas]UII75530.1 DUF4252 domain-containing protein [Flagellimonas sp. HMM57]